MGKCSVCGERSPTISGRLGVCGPCIKKYPEKAIRVTNATHAKSRALFGLPAEPPGDADGLPCGVCANKCMIGLGNMGFCGLVKNFEERLVRSGGIAEKGVLEWYYDGLPTNCVNWWFCPGCTGSGYPKYAHAPQAEYGFANLAVFYGACSYDCLFCQNWHYRKLSAECNPVVSAEALAAQVDAHVSCICYFGGDPSPQMPHSLEVSRLVLQKAKEEKRLVRLCWETNGSMNAELAQKAAGYALDSGGNIKFDLKTWNQELNVALCGVSNRSALENFAMLAERFCDKRPELPILSASTLLVPGYVDSEEVENIAKYISEINAAVPYTLLAFYPHHVMNDLPRTSRSQAEQCLHAAQKYLKRVRLGNVHLLSGK